MIYRQFLRSLNVKLLSAFGIIFLFLISSFAPAASFELIPDKHIVKATKRILLKHYPAAHNPSLFKIDQGFILTFRYLPELYKEPWVSQIGAVLLDDAFEQISSPQILNTRTVGSSTPSQAEDARIFSYRGRLFLIYNDNVDITAPTLWDRRDMFMAELSYDGLRFSLSTPLKLTYEEKAYQLWQKNWDAFEWRGTLLLSYSINPHEILYPNFMTGACYHCYDTSETLNWKWGTLRGSTPPLLVDGEYLAFFHSGKKIATTASHGWELWHYFMGAYTFSAEPPFQITKITEEPIVAEGFYTPSYNEKRVIFPGGCVISGDSIYVAYGKDDCEVWIATLDKKALMEALEPVGGK